MDHDLIIIGGGLAGLTTANRAAELGLRPVVLEQGSDERYPCNSRYAGGLVHVAFKDMAQDADALHDAIEGVTGGQTDQGSPGNSPKRARAPSSGCAARAPNSSRRDRRNGCAGCWRRRGRARPA